MAVLPALAVLWALAPSEDCTATIRGRVVDAATGEGIPSADVRLEGTSLDGATGDDGTWTIDGVCPGTYRVHVSRADYEARARSVGVRDTEAVVDVSLEPVEVGVLEDVVVVAPARERVETAPSDTLEGAELDRVRGRSLADALASISGVTVLRGPAGGMGKPILRGMQGQRNLILYDRVRLESQKWGIEHAPEIDPFAADSITVIKGAGGIRYGPDAIGGVVLVDPAPLPETPGVSGETHAIGVSNGLRGTTATRIQGAHARAPGFAWRVDANASRGAALVTPDYPLDNTGSRIWNAGATLGYQRRGFSLTGSFRRHDLKAGVFTGLRVDTPDEFEAALALDRPQGADLYRREYGIDRPFQQVTHDLGIVRGRAPLGSAGDLVATYSIQNDDRDEFDVVREAVTGPQFEFDLLTHAGELAFEQAPAPLGTRASLEGTVGGSYMRQRNRFDGSDPGFLPDYTQDMGGVFLIERVVLERVEVEGGARYDGMTRRSTLARQSFLPARAQGRLPDDCQALPDDAGTCTTSFHAGSGSLGVLVRPVRRAPGFVTKLDASTAVRFPTVDEQFIKGSAPSFPIFANGNGRLDVERSWGGGPTVGFANAWTVVEGSAYVTFIDDYIYSRAELQDDPECGELTRGIRGCFPLFAPVAVDALFYGGELGGTVRPPQWPVGFDVQGSWVRARQLPGSVGIAFIPPDRYRLGVTWYWPDFGPFEHGFLGVRGTIVDRQHDAEEAADFAPPPPAYALLGAETGVEIPFDGQRLTIALTGSNLTNTRYRDYTSLIRYFANEPGWELMLRITLEFEFVRRRSRTKSV
jgi:iron complex outermembrane receptor protein